MLELPYLTAHDDVLTIDDIGKCFQVTVIDPISGNSCWGKLCVEDKQAPEVDCPADLTVACNESLDTAHTGSPVLLSCEIDVTTTFIDRVTEFADCDSIRLEVERTFITVDDSGNRTECTQLISVKGFDLADVRFPRHYDDLDLPALECDARRDDNIDVSPHIVRWFEGCVDDYLLDTAYFNMTGERRPMRLGWNDLRSGPNAGNPSPYPVYYEEHPDWAANQRCWDGNTHVMWTGTGTPTINGQ